MLGRYLIAVLSAALMVFSAGCGRGSHDAPEVTSQQELADFLKENPDYAGASSRPPSSKAPLELGR